MDYPAQRRDRLAHSVRQENLDALLVSNPVNVTYLTGFSGDSSMLIVTGSRVVLVSDPRFVGQLEEECPGLPTQIRPPARKPHEAVAEVLTGLGCHAVGFESAAVTVAELELLRELAPALDWKGAEGRVEDLRRVKDPWEVGEIRFAIDVAERAFLAFRALLRPGDSERDLADTLEYFLRRAGGRGSSFPTIVAAGDRSALPHAPPSSRLLGSAELVLVDWGAAGRLYKSDLTRVLDGRTNSLFREATPSARGQLDTVHAAVLEAQSRAIRAVRPGVQAQAVDAAARAYLAEAGYGEAFGHGLGHGIGLQVHESPAIRPRSETVLEAGMVFTIEPGVYLPGWGGVRIEDDVLVTPDGCEVLSRLPRDLEALRAFA